MASKFITPEMTYALRSAAYLAHTVGRETWYDLISSVDADALDVPRFYQDEDGAWTDLNEVTDATENNARGKSLPGWQYYVADNDTDGTAYRVITSGDTAVAVEVVNVSYDVR